EGNLEFRQGERVIYAQRMFYDARRQTGVVLDAELLTPLPELDGYQYRGLVRLKADAIRQLEDSRYVAENALFTTSRLEEPTYSLRADRITLEDYRRPLIDPLTGEPAANPFTGTALEEREQNAASEGNRVYFGDVPIFYWPRFETDLREPTFYIDGFRVRNDAIFGFQVLTDWDVYQLLGSKAPAGTDWTVGLDYLSERGLGYGTTYQYEVDRFAGADGPASGRTDLWFISDNDTDNLGFGRRDIDPEASFRGRAFWDHKQSVRTGVLAGWETQAQVGWISDRTFLEQYYEQEWDAGADQATGFRLRRRIDNQSLSIEANAKLNDFFTESQWLPRVDHWLMGSDLGTGAVTWFAHTHAGYANLNPATPPIDAGLAAQYALFPWEAPVEGERFATRQEIDLPIDLEPYGLPAKVVPFILGEFAHWGDTLAGGDLQRAYVHTGVRASAPFWKVNPDVRDPVFNLDGLAHKVVFDAEASYADSSRNLTDLPLYDEIEDNSLEEIRRRLFFPGVPEAQDPRFYLVRTGIQGWVGAPTTEVVEDLSVARVGMRHRLQTKRGAPGQQRIVDWLTIDTNASLFPESDENNLGETLGLVDYDLAWHLGDRFTVLSDGFVDLFTDGLQTFSAGIAANRPSRGNAYIGYRSIRGPFNSDLVSLRLAYRMGPKWVGEAATVIDFGEAGNIGQSFSLSRIGESLIFTVGATVDESKDNTGLRFLVEPRFLPSTTLTRRTGIDIPPAGAFGLE
ncbi:MAG: organic solvent tolerance protein OstA, partial [Planctomycetota bacterium]